MEEQVTRLVEKTWAKFQSIPPDQRLLIAIIRDPRLRYLASLPISDSSLSEKGKTTLATTITTRLNTLSATLHGKTTTPPIACYIPMDGYHLTRAQLSAMPDPENAHARRGAAFTFDPSSLLSLIRLLRAPITTRTPAYFAPSFDHAIKDPVENDIPIPPTSRILVLEGNYLSLGKGEWKEITELMDELWFVEVEEEVAGMRLVPRHVKAGIAADEESAWKRVWENDLVNGREIMQGRVEVTEVVVSREDDAWKPKT